MGPAVHRAVASWFHAAFGVSDLGQERVRLDRAGFAPGRIIAATTTDMVGLRDQDDNLVVPARPREP